MTPHYKTLEDICIGSRIEILCVDHTFEMLRIMYCGCCYVKLQIHERKFGIPQGNV